MNREGDCPKAFRSRHWHWPSMSPKVRWSSLTSVAPVQAVHALFQVAKPARAYPPDCDGIPVLRTIQPDLERYIDQWAWALEGRYENAEVNGKAPESYQQWKDRYNPTIFSETEWESRYHPYFDAPNRFNGAMDSLNDPFNERYRGTRRLPKSMTAMYSVTEPIGIEIAVIAVIAVICSAINGSTRQAAKLKRTVNGYQFHSAGTKWVSPDTIRPSLSHLQPCQHLRPNHMQPADRYITPWRLNMVEN